MKPDRKEVFRRKELEEGGKKGEKRLQNKRRGKKSGGMRRIEDGEEKGGISCL